MQQKTLAFISSLAMLICAASGLEAQPYPAKPIRIVTSAAGGGNDFVARVVSQALSPTLGQQVIVDNRTALGAIEAVLRAKPDGYTVLLVANTFWTQPLLRKVSYDTIKDFAPVAMVASTPVVLVVHPSLPTKSTEDLIRLAKRRPGELNYGTPSVGSQSHIAGELFKYMAGVNILHVAYKGTGPAVMSLLGGEVQLMFPNLAAAGPHVRSGKLRALAVSTLGPSSLAPGLPSIAASLPGFRIEDAKGVFLPQGRQPSLSTS